MAAVSHRLQQTLGHVAVDDTTNEVGACPALLTGLLLAGRVGTMAALRTRREGAPTIRNRGGDSVLVVKDTQPNVHEAVATVVTAPRLP